MMDFVLLVMAIVVSNLLTTGIALAVVCNKKVMKKYMKWCTKMSEEIADELLDEFLDKE